MLAIYSPTRRLTNSPSYIIIITQIMNTLSIQNQQYCQRNASLLVERKLLIINQERMHSNLERPYLSISKPKYSANMETLHRYSIDNYKSGNQTNIENEVSQKSSFADKMCETITLMMDHVSKTVTRLLENLNYLYQTNGIDYQVSQYYRTLMRLLTPHQLLSHFHIQDNNQLFKGNQKEKQMLAQCTFKQKYNLISDSKNMTQQKIFLKQKKRAQKLNPHMSSQLNSINCLGQNTLCLKKIANQKYNGGKPILGLSVEKQLAKWVLQELGMSKILKMKDIAAKTKQFAYKYRGFKCSIGWVNRFLSRHPYLKQMMKLAKQRKFDKVRQLYLKVRRALQKEMNEDIKAYNSQMGQYNYPQFTEINEEDKQQNSQLSEGYINSSSEDNFLGNINSDISQKSEIGKKQQEQQQELLYKYSNKEYNSTENQNRFQIHDGKEKKYKKSSMIKSSEQSNEQNEDSIDNESQQVLGQGRYSSLKDRSEQSYQVSQKKILRRDQIQKRRG